LKVEATELRDKFRVYKLLIFQYYFSKVVVWLLYGADMFLPRFGVASTYNFFKEPILVHRVFTLHNFLRLLTQTTCMSKGRSKDILKETVLDVQKTS